jgi:RimJ/RimL family protein N-acetyltransferase
LLRSIVTDRHIYRASVLSDYAPAPEQYQIPEEPGIWYVLARNESGVLGLFVFMPRTPLWSEVHMCLLPAAWGRGSAALCLACASWFAAQTECRVLTATVPAYNRPMLALAVRIGMRAVGVLPLSVLKQGMRRDQTIFWLAI